LHHDFAAENARLIDAALFGHWTLGLIPAASLLAKAAIAASRVAA
jgi:hypothetical protein